MFLAKKSLITIVLVVVAITPLASYVLAPPAQAETLKEIFFGPDLQSLATLYGYPETTTPPSSPTYIVARFVRILLVLMGTIFLVLMVWGGFMWMMAGGNEEKVKKATAVLGNAVIGLLIVFIAYVFTWFVVREVFQATTGRTVPYSSHTSFW